ncbi:type II RES/Xre toxin-antitoxin system antitoxin [Longitalea arenae]|uniref:type II RES/Xre toxin-antitoxin system antitoxin n=1 Tax=Longitalea arenae TaxID=2812558 RepID=UPI00196840D1|nr:antitoxin Xre/MbcA/ParS toxin-binding domain-containing protein [Longitalea arenae]
MAGNKKHHANTNHFTGNGVTHAYANDHTQTVTLSAPAPAIAPRLHTESTGPFNFEALTSQYKIGIIRNGITKKQLEAIKSETDLDYHTLSTLLSVSRTTLIKKKGDDRFDQPTSERIMLLAELLSYGRDVLESKERFNAWIKMPSLTLGGKAPLELLDTLYGIEEVKKELGRIEYGVY